MKRVFLSSTAEDLVEHRKAVARAIERLGEATVRMEAFVADPGTPVDVCREKAAAADILVVLVAHRYGWVPSAGEGGDGAKSITWHEVDAAEEAQKPVLAFLVEPDHPWPHGKEQDDLVDAEEEADSLRIAERVRALKTFRQHLQERVVGAFTKPDDLATKVLAALHHQLSPHDGRGASGKGLKHYLEALERRTAHLNIQGIATAPGRARAAQRYPIEALYTTLRTRQPLERGVVGAGAGDGEPLIERGESVELSDLLTRRRLLIEGQPGAGKSTFLRLVACMLARDLLEEPAPDGGSWAVRHLGLAGPPRLPLLAPLGELVPLMSGKARRKLRNEVWLLDLLEDQCGRADIDLPRKQIQARLERGEAVLLLDGLDEVADGDLRQQVFEVVRDALDAWKKCTVVVASRPIDTSALRDMGFHHATIEPFDLGAIEEFLGRWTTALYADSVAGESPLSPEGRGYLDKLTAAVTGRSRIRQIAANPVMLTCLCVVHWNEGELPEGRSRVYAAVIRWLLEARRAERDARGYSQHFAQKAFAALALAMMTTAKGKRSTLDLAEAAAAIDDVVAREWSDLCAQDRDHKARAWLRFECTGSGIIEEIARNRLRFWHLTFQEYLAAVQLAWLRDGADGLDDWWPRVRDRLTDAQWRETVDLLPGCLLDEGGERRVDQLLQRVLELHGAGDGLAQDARAAGIVGRLLDHVRVYGYKPRPEIESAYRRALDRAMEIFTVAGAKQVGVTDRIAAAEALGQGGDPRLQSFRDNLLPVPERPGLLLGKYPVTVEEYQAFVDDRGYEAPRFWSPAGRMAREKAEWQAPDGWEQQLRTPNRPVVSVSWYEAEAYCAWLANLSNLPVRLPTEDDWFAAAQHPEGDYPWGKRKPTEELANFGRNVGKATPVGVNPAGAGRGGHLDLAGNVWEWCADEVGKGGRALRGGSWWGGGDLRSARRLRVDADYRDDFVGFRVAVSAASTDHP